MTNANVKQIVSMVLETNQNQVSREELIGKIVELGAHRDAAPSILESVHSGFKAGTVVVITGGMSAEGYVPGRDPFFDLAFRRGKAAMRYTTPSWLMLKTALPILIAVAVVGLVLWAWFR